MHRVCGHSLQGHGAHGVTVLAPPAAASLRLPLNPKLNDTGGTAAAAGAGAASSAAATTASSGSTAAGGQLERRMVAR